MNKFTLSLLGCLSLATLGLAATSGSVYADDEVTSDSGNDPVVSDGDGSAGEPIVVDTGVDEPVDQPEYDPIIAESNGPLPPGANIRNLGGSDKPAAVSNRVSESHRSDAEPWQPRKAKNGLRPSLFGKYSPLRDWMKKVTN
jgi:hypothetical protein